MELTLKTEEELLKEGWRFSCGFFRDNTADKYQHQIRIWTLRELGNKVSVIDVNDNSEYGPTYIAINENGYSVQIPWVLIKGKIPNKKSLVKETIKKNINGSTAVYYKTAGRFEFDCDFARTDKRTAKKLALWVLKVSQ